MMFVIITRDDCVWCEKAKKLIAKKGDSFAEYNISDKPDFKRFIKDNGLFTVPQIFLEGQLVGGYMDLEKAYDTTID